MKQDKKSAELLKPFLKGEEIKRWCVESEGLFLINTPKGKVDIEEYPSVRGWLLPFKTDLERRATKQEWWELQQAQLAYQSRFGSRKIVYLDIANGPPLALDTNGALIDCTVFAVTGTDGSLLPYLNSRVAWLQLIGETPIARGGYIRLKQQYISPIVLPDGSKSKLAQLAGIGQKILELSTRNVFLRKSTRHRILEDLAPAERKKLTNRLDNFWTLDFGAFRIEVKKAFKVEIPVKDRDDWEKYLAEKSAEVIKLKAEIEAAEREVDAIVYELFDLTPDEIKLLEDSLEGRF